MPFFCQMARSVHYAYVDPNRSLDGVDPKLIQPHKAS